MVSRPIALGLTLCDYVIVEEGTKKVFLIGTFTKIRAPQSPSVARPFSVFATLTDGQGSARVKVVVTRLDTDEEVYAIEEQAQFPNKLTEVWIHFRLRRCRFPVPGLYQFVLLVDNEWVAQRRVHVHLKEDQP